MNWKDTSEAARYLQGRGIPGASAYRLKQLRTIGGGPRYRKIGRFVRYADPDLDEWADSRLGPPRLSTSQTVEA